MRGTSKLIITAHCAARMRQRGYRSTDLETVESLGASSSGGIVLRRKDVEPELARLYVQLKMIRQRRIALQSLVPSDDRGAERDILRHIERVRRLAGTYIPLVAGHALSIYRPCERRLKHILRGRRTYRFRRQSRTHANDRRWI